MRRLAVFEDGEVSERVNNQITPVILPEVEIQVDRSYPNIQEPRQELRQRIGITAEHIDVEETTTKNDKLSKRSLSRKRMRRLSSLLKSDTIEIYVRGDHTTQLSLRFERYRAGFSYLTSIKRNTQSAPIFFYAGHVKKTLAERIGELGHWSHTQYDEMST
ncbi:hypothetical protein RB195_016545 [Necator americanus]|uniref:Uncharacterized protein n=1 Tax=Necator americanus TaxID=51031 RepID=A0ABR1C475_NECAM